LLDSVKERRPLRSASYNITIETGQHSRELGAWLPAQPALGLDERDVYVKSKATAANATCCSWNNFIEMKTIN